MLFWSISLILAVITTVFLAMPLWRGLWGSGEARTDMAIYRDQLASENKPAEIIEKIITGRLEKYYEQNVLLEQSFVKDSSKSVQEVLKEEGGEGVTVRTFIRYNLGEEVDETVDGAQG